MKQLILFSTLILFAQCSSISGFYSGYKNLTAEQKSNVVQTADGGICGVQNDEKIHMINTDQLRSCLKQHQKSLLYQWSPNCHSDVCILIAACQEYCDKNGIELYVLADYYDWDQMEGQNVAKRPIFVLEHAYYKTDYVIKINRLFLEDLAPNHPLIGEKEYGRFLFFEGDQLVERRNKLL